MSAKTLVESDFTKRMNAIGAQRSIEDARAHARSWSAIYRGELRFARAHAGTAYWPIAWEHLQQAVTVSRPEAIKAWRKYRAMLAVG